MPEQIFFPTSPLVVLYRGSPKFYQVRTIFDWDWAQKTHLTKLVLKRSALKQFLPNSQCKLLWRSQYQSYIEAAKYNVIIIKVFDTSCLALFCIYMYIMAQIVYLSPFSTLVIIFKCLVDDTHLFKAGNCYFEIRILSKHDMKDY